MERTVPKMAKNGQKCVQLVTKSPKTKSGPYLGLVGQNKQYHGTQSTCNPPLFVVSKPQNRPTRRLDPRTSPISRHFGIFHTRKRVNTVEHPRWYGTPLETIFFDPWTSVDPPLAPHRARPGGALQLHQPTDPFRTKNGSKMGPKRMFPKVILDHLGCSNKCF